VYTYVELVYKIAIVLSSVSHAFDRFPKFEKLISISALDPRYKSKRTQWKDKQ
jgi:hypothetical protein